MTAISIVSFALILLYVLLFLTFSILTGNIIKTIILNSFSGIILLLLLCLLEKFLQCGLMINIYTLLVSAFLGIPGVIMQLLINLLFF